MKSFSNLFRISSILLFYTCSVMNFSQEWTNKIESTMFRLAFVKEIIQNDNVVNIPQGRSLSTCMVHCTARKYASFFFFENIRTCLCNPGYVDSENIANENTGVVYGTKKANVSTSYLQNGNERYKRIHRNPGNFDCLSLYELGYTENGVYVVQPTKDINVEAWCDMSNGGWTVFQRREDGSVNFYRGWEDYENGFGNKLGEYWLGLRHIKMLTTNLSSLFIEMEAFADDHVEPKFAYAQYSSFTVNDESDKYRLSVSGFDGNCSDSLSWQNNWRFSTFDNDNDGGEFENCAELFTGAWWYKTCHASNLNGMYLGGTDSEYGKGIVWSDCWGHSYSLKRTVMKVRRNTLIL